jgi:hypothetical protein
MVGVRPLVVVAGPEPPVTDDLADRLRETCVVRTAYSVDEVLDRLDADVDVVLVAPELGPGAVNCVRRGVDERGLPCRLARLTADDDGGGGVGTDSENAIGAEYAPTTVDPSGTDRAVRADVERLATLAQYETALDEYFSLARRSAGDDDIGSNDPENQLSYVRDRLDDAAADLDPASLFEAALCDPGPAGELDERSDVQPEEQSDDSHDE